MAETVPLILWRMDGSVNELPYVYRCLSWLKSLIAPIIGLFSKSLAQFFLTTPHSGAEIWIHNAMMYTLISLGKRLVMMFWSIQAWLNQHFLQSMATCCLDLNLQVCGLCWLDALTWDCSGISYTAVYNLVGCPVGAITVIKQNEEDEEMSEEIMKKDIMNRRVGKVAKGLNPMLSQNSHNNKK